MNSENRKKDKLKLVTIKVIVFVVAISAFMTIFARFPESNSYFTSRVESGEIIID